MYFMKSPEMKIIPQNIGDKKNFSKKNKFPKSQILKISKKSKSFFLTLQNG